MTSTEIIDKIKNYCLKRDDITMAFLIGSIARGTMREESDIDIAVYFSSDRIEMEDSDNLHEGQEDEVHAELTRLLNLEIDLIVLNRAPAYICDEAVRKGMPIIIKDHGVYIDYLLRVSDEAEFYRNNIEDIYEMRYGYRL
jgi:predicted nucleotidyltransferase